MNGTFDWTNPLCKLSNFFSVKEALWLHQLNRLATEADGLDNNIKANLLNLCTKLDQLRAFLNAPMVVTSMYRPPAYSQFIGGSPTDVHTRGLACDFTVEGIECANVKSLLFPQLAAFEIRMEKGTTNWVHIDISPVGPSGRYFNP